MESSTSFDLAVGGALFAIGAPPLVKVLPHKTHLVIEQALRATGASDQLF
jgi:hypothetical protein